MVKRPNLLWIAIIIILYGCTRPISQYLCDYYYNDAGGVRSHHKYKRYEDLTTPLPPGIEENVVYETLYSVKKDDGERTEMKSTKVLSRFFSNGRCAFKDLPKGTEPSRQMINIDTWEMGYYEKSKNGYRIYSYGTLNCGQFGKDSKLSKWSPDTLIFESNSYYNYSIKVFGIPEEWLTNQQPDW